MKLYMSLLLAVTAMSTKLTFLRNGDDEPAEDGENDFLDLGMDLLKKANFSVDVKSPVDVIDPVFEVNVDIDKSLLRQLTGEIEETEA